MTELKFVLKTLLLTVAIVIVLQIQMGGRTLESRALQFVQSSQVVEPLNSVARGAARAYRDLLSLVKQKISGKSSSPENRAIRI